MEKDVDSMALKFTSPVIKKKNARQHRRAATTALVLDADNNDMSSLVAMENAPGNVSKDESCIRPVSFAL